MPKRVKHDAGFSMVEMMAVVAILGILVMIAVASYRLSTVAARKATCTENQRNLSTSLVLYEDEHDGAAPTDITDLAPYVTNFASASVCPNQDGTVLLYNPVTKRVTCPNHP